MIILLDLVVLINFSLVVVVVVVEAVVIVNFVIGEGSGVVTTSGSKISACVVSNESVVSDAISVVNSSGVVGSAVVELLL